MPCMWTYVPKWCGLGGRELEGELAAWREGLSISGQVVGIAEGTAFSCVPFRSCVNYMHETRSLLRGLIVVKSG